MESRSAYGYGGNGINSPETTKKWELCYRCKDGGFGIVGWKLFKSERECLEFGQQFKSEKSYVTEVWARHPSKCYSAY